MQALKVKFEDEDLEEECRINYELQAWDNDADAYVDIADWLETLHLEQENASEEFWSWIHFDTETSDFYAELWNKDLEQLVDRFTDSDTGAVSFKFKTVARLPRSATQGATAATDDLVSGTFAVHVIDLATVQTCADNSLSTADNSYYDPESSRPSEIEYHIQANDGVVPAYLPGRKIIATSTDCPIVSSLEVHFPHKMNPDGSDYWEKVRSNEFHTQYLTIDETMYVEFFATQYDFISTLVPEFAVYDHTEDMN
jgi:hypothetical protein